MSKQKRRGYRPPVVSSRGHSFRFDSRDILHSVGVWRSPEILNAVVGNLVGLFFLALLVPAFFWVSENTERNNKLRDLKNECNFQLLQSQGKTDSRYCFLKAKSQLLKESR